MPVIETKDGIFIELPDGVDPNAPEVRAKVNEVRVQRRQSPEAVAKREAAIKAEQDAERERFKAEEGKRSWATRAYTNLGAGGHSFMQSMQQLGGLVGLGKGVSDEEIDEHRARKQELADSTAGGGLIQLAGETAPSAVLGAGAGAAVGRALTMLPRVAKLAQVGRGLVGQVGRGAVEGGVTAATAGPTRSDESIGTKVAVGAGLGGALPLATRALGAGYRTARDLTWGRQAAAHRKAAKGLADELGPDAQREADMLDNYTPPNELADVPMTTAQRARLAGEKGPAGAKLAQLERGVRQGNPEFTDLVRRQNEALYESAVNRAGAEAPQIDLLKRNRASATDPLRKEALESAGRWSHVGEPLQAHVDDLIARSVPGSPQRALAKKTAEMLGENPTPEQLYAYRKLLAEKLHGPARFGDEFSAVVKDADRETVALMKAIDDRLDAAASSKALGDKPWRRYMDEYMERSKPLASARTQQRISESLSPEGGQLLGNAPVVTRHRLSQALRKHAENKYGDTLTPGARQRYDRLMEGMQALEEPNIAVSAGAGGGSPTATNIASQGLAEKLVTRGAHAAADNVVPGSSLIVDRLLGGAPERVKAELVQMMLNPQAASSAIRQALQKGEPLTAVQKAFLAAARSGAVGALAAPMTGP